MRLLRSAALLLALLPGGAQAAEPILTPLRSVATPGATVFKTDEIRAILRLKLDAPLYRQPEAIAASLQQRYRDGGYPAARVTGVFDAESGALTLTVDEGRVNAVSVSGLEGKAAARALAEAKLEPGGVLQDSDAEGALLRMETASDGALGFGKYTLEETDKTDGKISGGAPPAA